MNAKGYNGSISIANDGYIEITRKGLMASVTHKGKSGVRIPISEVIRVEVRKATVAVNGYIYFETLEDKNSGVPYDHISNDNTVIFTFMSAKAFETIRAFVDNAILNQPNSNAAHQPFEIAEELKKLADLRDQGILSAEEFSLQKKKLLDLN
jgi:hypothetical protein